MKVKQENLVEVTWNQGQPVNTLAPNAKFPVESDCGDIMFINQTTVTVVINNMPLPAGASITFGANTGEILRGTFYVKAPPPVGNAAVYVFRKTYK